MVQIEKKEYKGWKNCISITNGLVDLIATTDVGPRVIYFGLSGKCNEFCEVEDQVGTSGSDEWKVYGGHRLWHSPENLPRTYQPDNSPIEWKEKENGIILIQPVESLTGIQKEMEITLSPDKAKATVLHRLTNKGVWPVELAAWAVTVMAPGGKEIMPQIIKNTGYLPNRAVSLWPYSKLNDPRVCWGEKYITLQQDTNATVAFKLGICIEDGWAGYCNNGHLFIKQYEHYDDELYPDLGVSYESYTCDFMTEMETLSPLVILDSGESVEHTETWSLYDNVKMPVNEKEIEEIIIPLIK